MDMVMHASDRTGHARPEDSVGELVSRASRQLSRLVRDEMRLAQAEMAEKDKRFGLGGAGVMAFVGLQALAATAIAVIALALPVWAAALIITGVLFLIAGVLAAMGRKQVHRATPPAPTETIDSVKRDVAEMKVRAKR